MLQFNAETTRLLENAYRGRVLRIREPLLRWDLGRARRPCDPTASDGNPTPVQLGVPCERSPACLVVVLPYG